MKTKAKKMILGLSLALSASYAQAQGIDGIIVEKYYVPNAADIANATSNVATVPLTANSVTYRVYVDMAAGWKFSLLKGNSFHSLKINTTTQFYNDPNNGVVVGAQATSTLNVRKNTVMIDSWLTTGGTAVGKVGVIESQDTDGSLGNAQGVLANNPGGLYGAPINGAGAADGMINGTTSAPTVLGFGTATDIFDQTPGGSFLVNNGAMAILGGALGYGPNNTMLLGQFTTDGVFSFELNIQLINPTGTAVEYVANNPQAGETVYPGLTYSVCPPYISNLTALSSTNTCIGNSVALSTNTISGASYTWYSGSTPISGVTTQTYTATASGNYSVNLNYFGCIVASNSLSLVFNPLPTLSLTTTSSAICAGKTASLSVSGANTYSWTGGGNNASYTVSPIANTVYSVTGTDANNCSNTATITIVVNPTPTVQITASQLAICPSETATLTLSGALTYTWTNNSTSISYTVSPTTNTTYSVIGADVNGCIGNAAVTLTVNPSPSISISASNSVICSGNSSLLTASGANTYSWTNGPNASTYSVSPLTNTTYTVIGRDLNNCSNQGIITLSVNTTPTVIATAISNTICAGQTTTLTASGASTYSWVSTGNTNVTEIVSPVINTNYSVIGTDNGCSATASVQIVANPIPTISVVSSNTLICAGESVTLTANTNGTVYTWSNAATTASISVSPSVTTVYSVTVSDGVCSSSSSITQNVSTCTAINQLEDLNFINVYPNPFNHSLEVLVNNSNEQNKSITINIYNVLGENVYSQKALGSKTIINTTDLGNGTYFVRVNDKVYKMIKQE